MKKLITPIILSLLFFISFFLFAFVGSGEPTYTLSEKEAIKVLTIAAHAQNLLLKSDMPVNKAAPIFEDINTITASIQSQYAKNHPDSLKKN